MKQREQARIQVLNTVLEQHLPIAQAAEIMGISERHTKRLLAAYRKEGPAALRVFRLLERSTDQGEGVGGFSGAATEGGGDVGFFSYSRETDDQVAQCCHDLWG